MKIPAIRNRIRQDLIDIDPEDYTFEDETLDRAFLSALEDYSRFCPDERFYDISINNSVISETIPSGTKPSTLTLTYKLIRFNSLAVVVGATTYVAGTDYTIDYINGTITIPLTSSIPNSTNLTITYNMSRYMFDLSDLTDLRQVTGLEVMVGAVPQQQSAAKLMGWILVVQTYNNSSQVELGSNVHLAVYYDARHTPPDDNNDGTLPETAVEIVVKGAIAQVLFAKAISIELAQTEPFNTIDFTTYLADITTFFTSIIADAASSRANLVLAATQAALAATQASSIVTSIAADIAGVASDLTDTVTSLNLVSTKTEAGLAYIDTEVQTDLALLAAESTNIGVVLGNAATRLTTAAADVALFDAWLQDALADRVAGESLINSVNAGLDPAGHYTAMASMIQANADRDIAAGDALTKQADNFVAQAVQFIAMANQYAQSAATRLELAKTFFAGANEYYNITEEYLKKAATRINSAQTRIGLLQGLVNVSRQYVDIAGGFHQGYIGLMNEENASIQNKLAVMQVILAKAAEERAQSDSLMGSAERLRLEAVRRYQDFQTICQDRNQTRRNGSSVATLQLSERTLGWNGLT